MIRDKCLGLCPLNLRAGAASWQVVLGVVRLTWRGDSFVIVSEAGPRPNLRRAEHDEPFVEAWNPRHRHGHTLESAKQAKEEGPDFEKELEHCPRSEVVVVGRFGERWEGADNGRW